MKRKKYGAFTLVEMLIVMGILSVLMAIGVSVARFAIQRANNIQHQNAVDQLFQAMQSYYTDNRRYPQIGASAALDTIQETNGIDTALNNSSTGALDLYVDANFDGGSSAKYYILVPDNAYPQEFLACVSYAEPGAIATSPYGGYCNGNGFGVITVPTYNTESTIDSKIMDADEFRAKVNDGPATGTNQAEQCWDGTDWTTINCP